LTTYSWASDDTSNIAPARRQLSTTAYETGCDK
jgi:hypothetical protein